MNQWADQEMLLGKKFIIQVSFVIFDVCSGLSGLSPGGTAIYGLYMYVPL